MPITITGAQVRAWRLRLGLTQVALAQALGYTRQAISKWERHPTLAIPRAMRHPLITALRKERDSETTIATSIQDVDNLLTA
jgi:DNA-binding XRE family transcriptional regulator